MKKKKKTWSSILTELKKLKIFKIIKNDPLQSIFDLTLKF